MIELTINGERKKIPEADKLTTRQYIDILHTDEGNILNYLSVVLNVKYKSVYDSQIKGFDKLKRRIGDLKDYRKITPKNVLTFDDGLYYYTKGLEISTVGQRFTIEENAKNLKNEELIVFILAVALVKDSTDVDIVKAMFDKLMKQKYTEVLPQAFFLASRFLTGKNYEINFFAKLLLQLRTTISKNKRALRSFQSFLTITRFRLYAIYLTSPIQKYLSSTTATQQKF